MMASLDLAAVAQYLGTPYEGRPVAVGGAAIDSRRVEAGDLFVAVPGAQVDGHSYIASAAERGAIAALTERPVSAPIPCLVVEDSLAALAALARRNRDAYEGCVLAITGSCGKTSVKNICRAMLSRAGRTVATRGNYNNEIGVPLTLARLSDDVRYAVVEMGATGRGDVAYLCDLARPRISTVLNAMEAHLDGFGSVADVADVKAEIYDGLGRESIAVLSLDSPYSELWKQRIDATGARTVSWSLRGPADITARDLRDLAAQGTEFELEVDGEHARVRLPLPGRHNVANALVAAALARGAGLDLGPIADGIAAAEGEPGRLQHEKLANGLTLIDDSYNANPGSVRAAIDFLAGVEGRRGLVLGEMLELGPDARRMHAEMGSRARERGLDLFVGVGDALAPAVDAFGAEGQLFRDRAELAGSAAALMAACDVLLVKGSRGAAMEHVIDDLRAVAGGGQALC
ncbi:MAG: UDP-N-acetylmuramoyl-tripeptide--D-alanyl-D-alanine ligase [Pseudomonadota bacterium]